MHTIEFPEYADHQPIRPGYPYPPAAVIGATQDDAERQAAVERSTYETAYRAAVAADQN